MLERVKINISRRDIKNQFHKNKNEENVSHKMNKNIWRMRAKIISMIAILGLRRN